VPWARPALAALSYSRAALGGRFFPSPLLRRRRSRLHFHLARKPLV